MNYKLSKKNSQDKWWSWGSVKKNQWDKLQASFKVTKEFKEMINAIETDGWLNFAMFEDDGKYAKKEEKIEKPYDNNPGAINDIDDEIPFG